MDMTEYYVKKKETEEMRDLVLEGLHKGNHKDPDTGELCPFFVSQIFSVVDILQEHGYHKTDNACKETLKEVITKILSLIKEERDEISSFPKSSFTAASQGLTGMEMGLNRAISAIRVVASNYGIELENN